MMEKWVQLNSSVGERKLTVTLAAQRLIILMLNKYVYSVYHHS